MKIITTLMFCFFLQNLHAQTKEPNAKALNLQFAASVNVGLQINVYNKGLISLNQSLENNNIPTLLPIFYTVGSAFVIKHNDTKSRMSFFELSYSESRTVNGVLTDRDLLVPNIIGLNFAGVNTQKIWEKKNLRFDGGLGLGLSKYNMRLIDRRNYQIPLDTFLKYPNQLSASLDFTQKHFNWNIVGRLGMTYNTQWFKKVAYAYEFSLFLDYTQSVYGSKDWLIAGTNIPVVNFSKINFSNVRFLLSNNVFFNYAYKKSFKAPKNQ